jgi:membrane associated rhomboid family serine protease
MFPVGDFLRTRTTPVVNYTLIAINVAVFVYTLTLNTQPSEPMVTGAVISEAERFYFDWGFVPACIGQHFGLDPDVSSRALQQICPPGDRELIQPFTSMFIHGGWAHIIGNMLFLWVFGDNVEDRIGHLRYLVFYFIAGAAAGAAQTVMALDTLVPAVGASGAISGVMGGYLVLFPTAIVQVVIFPLIFLPFFVPSIVLIGFWFVMQLFSGFAEVGQTTAGSGVAWWAHIGGFIAGVVLIWSLKRPTRRPRFAQSFRDT